MRDKKKLSQALRNNLLRRKAAQNKEKMTEKKLYEGKAKILYETENQNQLIQYFKDDATAFNNVKKDVIADKGVLNNVISEFIMLKLAENGVPTHFVKRLDERRQLVKRAKIIPLEAIVRNIAAGTMAKRLGIEEGSELLDSVFEICYKDDSLHDPLINEDHAVNVLRVIDREKMAKIKDLALKVNKILQKIFLDAKIILVDFKLEFGFDENGEIMLADEVSPDSCRLWDIETKQKLDKDVFRRDLGDLITVYQEVARRLGINID